MPDYAYGKTNDKTRRVRVLIEQVSSLGELTTINLPAARALLDEIQTDYSSVDDVFVSSARKMLSDIVSDGTIDNEERALLRNLAATLSNPISDEPVSSFDNQAFVLTGDFEMEGGKETAKEMIVAAGGIIKSSVSRKTQYVVVGAKGSDAWGYGNFGNKTKDALDLQLTGKSNIKIVSEKALTEALKSASPEATKVLQDKAELFKKQWESAKVVTNDFTGLTAGQQRAFDLVKDGRNVYLTGLGGTGKSYVLNQIIDWAHSIEKNVIVCAPTGIAALNVGGSTIHRALGIGPEKPLGINPNPYIPKNSPLIACDLMIIDEISMCRMDLFDYLSLALKKAAALRHSSGRECCQLVVVGDFCQLPPVIPKPEQKILDEKYGFHVRGGYPFMGTEWSSWDFEKVELQEAIRQRNASFVAALNACRMGDLSGVRWIDEHSASSPQDDSIVLCGRNDQANRENEQRLELLPEETTQYGSRITGEVTIKDMPTSQTVSLKPGARVMALVNNSDDTYMNGELGTVINCSKSGATVDFDGTGKTFVGMHTWEITEPYLINGKTRTKTIGTFEQIPLKLAWAITIHKSQGQTFDHAIIYPECWDYGQLYTALSRLSSVDGLYLVHEMSDSFLKTSPDVLGFLNDCYSRPVTAAPVPTAETVEKKRAESIRATGRKASIDRTNPAEQRDQDNLLSLGMPVNAGLNILSREGVGSLHELIGLDESDLLSMRGMGLSKVKNLELFLIGKQIKRPSSTLPLTKEEYEEWYREQAAVE
ncbi:MAG: AAA family ATPase [Atopobiaceae bacterium]|jgi:hypothetical protein|nr:AAA family ATPase [Atopobiaceae bacterium]